MGAVKRTHPEVVRYEREYKRLHRAEQSCDAQNGKHTFWRMLFDAVLGPCQTEQPIEVAFPRSIIEQYGIDLASGPDWTGTCTGGDDD